MSRGRTAAVVVISVALLAAVAIALARGPGPPQRERGLAERRAGVVEQALQSVSVAQRRARRRRARSEDPLGEPGPKSGSIRLYRRVRAEAEPVAREFHAAFSRYELGARGAEQALQETATPRFGERLLAEPPRRPLGPLVRRAALGALSLSLIGADQAGRRLMSIELVGYVARGGRREPIAFELRRIAGRWRVSGIGL